MSPLAGGLKPSRRESRGRRDSHIEVSEVIPESTEQEDEAI